MNNHYYSFIIVIVNIKNEKNHFFYFIIVKINRKKN